ncbi:Tpr-related protein family member, putative [Theileria annulata]|uniref:Tpr-related protein family member, putative n=1 Tax=Theileria annulata TaxID=5874 RepID=Q4U9Z8_THEAN|nr:Tpr-related protein family member, putative [Theileria annulata]CAI76355.1 Tpr-related protein family member, putative [Theileria annulata]|eukprot:XP_952980.1 Tpr-related protein family member, putative [Theileria annulata]
MAPCLVCNSAKEACENYTGDACSLLVSAYILAGLAMMLNIRLSYSSAPYALIRFKLPENLFSVFVRRMASALELWCLPSMLLGNIVDLLQKLVEGGHQVRALIYAKHYDIQGNTAPQTLKDKANLLKNKASLLHDAAKALGGDSALAALSVQAGSLRDAAKQGTGEDHLYKKAELLATHVDGGTELETKATAVITQFGLVQQAYDTLMAEAKKVTIPSDKQHLVTAVVDAYNALENIYERILNLTKLKIKANELNTQATDPKLSDLKAAASQLETDVKTLRDTPGTDAQTVKSQFEKVQSAYYKLTDDNKKKVSGQFNALNTVYSHIGFCYKTVKFWSIIVPSIVTQWLNFATYVLLLVVYLMGGESGHLTLFYFVIAISGVVFGINMTLLYSVDFYYIPVYIVGENTFPIITSFVHYLSTIMFGNRRKYNSDFLLVEIDIWVAILISLVAAVVWTVGYLIEGTNDIGDMKHIHAYGFSGSFNGYQLSPFLMIVVGMGLVFTIYPGIAPGMIVPFYLVDKIEMVLLVATIFPPVIIAMLRRYKPSWSPQHNTGTFNLWKEYEYAPDWTQPTKKETVYAYLWHLFDVLMVIKISLAALFIYSLHYRESNLSRSIVNQPKMSTFLSITYYMCHEILLALGFSGFIGNDGGDLILIPQYIGALFMIFLAFYSEGYIIEYKSHDPTNWATEGMTKWNAFC